MIPSLIFQPALTGLNDGIGTFKNPCSGCRGFAGPFPPPLWMSLFKNFTTILWPIDGPESQVFGNCRGPANSSVQK
jgi:hypothetical protein